MEEERGYSYNNKKGSGTEVELEEVFPVKEDIVLSKQLETENDTHPEVLIACQRQNIQKSDIFVVGQEDAYLNNQSFEDSNKETVVHTPHQLTRVKAWIRPVRYYLLLSPV